MGISLLVRRNVGAKIGMVGIMSLLVGCGEEV
jgi:hypothetical protein